MISTDFSRIQLFGPECPPVTKVTSVLAIFVTKHDLELSGASSTSGENIVIDLSDTFEDTDADFQYNEETNILRIGISFSLKQVARNIF